MNPDYRGPCTSIILPACDNADGLPAALESILHQTYRDFELIVVNDGPMDTATELLAGQTDPRIVVIAHQEQYGIARACNTGISAARGNLIGFIRSGDAWDRRKLEDQVRCFSCLPPEYGVVYSDVCKITPAGTRAYWHSPDLAGPELLNAYATGFQADSLGIGPALVRRTFLDLAGPFDEELRYFSATDMIIRLQRVCRFHHIEKPLYFSKSRPDSTADPFGRSIAHLLLLQKYPESLQDPVFATQQLDRIRRYLQQAPEGSPAVTLPALTEPDHGSFRHPARIPE
jgi:glycosyltransferase involved in cell wall biosynthesis